MTVRSRSICCHRKFVERKLCVCALADLFTLRVLNTVYQIVLSFVCRSPIEVSSALPSSNFHRRRKASNPRKHVIKQSAEGEGAS